MNKLSVLSPTLEEADLIGRAIAELEETLDLHGRILPKKAHQWDADVLLEVAGQELRYVCEVKHKIDRRSALLDLKTRGLAKPEGLLVTSYLSHELASACRELGLQFLDTAGNAYLDNGAGVYVYISGRRPHDLSRNTLEQATITPAALRMMFGFLADPSMLNAPYREIAPAVMVSTGAISKVFDTLETRGFIATLPGGKRVIAAPELLLGEWATGYLSRLKPKLKSYRFSGPPPAEFSRRWFPESGSNTYRSSDARKLYCVYRHRRAARVARTRQRFQVEGGPCRPDRSHPGILEHGSLRHVDSDRTAALDLCGPAWHARCAQSNGGETNRSGDHG